MLGTLSRQAVLASLLAGVVVAAPPEAPREVNQQREGVQQREGARPRQGAPVVEQRGAIQVQPGAQQPGIQQPGVVVETRRDGAQVARNDARELDRHIADCLMLGNQEEINLGQFASERAQDPRVKEFAQMLIRDHQALNQKLQSFSSQRQQAQGTIQAGPATVQTQTQQALPTGTPADRREARQELRQQGESARDAREAVRDAAQAGANIIAGADGTAGRRMEVTTGYRGESGSLNDQLYQIAREAKRNCEEMTKEELSKESGNKFDQAFVGSQIAAHIATLAQLKAAQGHVSPELQQVLADATQSVKQHKAHADQLMKDLNQNDSRGDRNNNRDRNNN